MYRTHTPQQSRAALCLYCLIPLLSIGCSKHSARDEGAVPVSGTVTYNSEPAEGATVTFASTVLTGAPGAGLTSADGRYTLSVKPGTYTVTVSKSEVPPPIQALSMEQAATNVTTPLREPKDLLPAKYKDPLTSPLTCDVAPHGNNTFDLTLSD